MTKKTYDEGFWNGVIIVLGIEFLLFTGFIFGAIIAGGGS